MCCRKGQTQGEFGSCPPASPWVGLDKEDMKQYDILSNPDVVISFVSASYIKDIGTAAK